MSQLPLLRTSGTVSQLYIPLRHSFQQGPSCFLSAMAQDVAACEAVVDQVSAMLATSRASWRSYLPVVRDSIRSLDSKGFMNQPEEVQRQLRFLDVFQKYAFVEQDSGAIEDVAGWCLQHWLAILQRYPDYTFVLSSKLFACKAVDSD